MKERYLLEDGSDNGFSLITDYDGNDEQAFDVNVKSGEILPVLPLRNMVLFPGVFLPITVGRKSSLKLIRDADKKHKDIAVVCQRSAHTEDPKLEDLHNIGTVGRIVRILDIGTGTGLVALMLAQRSLPDAKIVALEIDEAAAGQARENVARSPWQERIEVVQADFKKYRSSDKFDVIVSNPPYFVDSLECPDRQRAAARHNDSLTYEELLEGGNRLLAADGLFTVVIPTDVVDRVKAIASMNKLYAIRQLNVITKPGGIPKRTLIAFSFSNRECVIEELLTELARHQYSEEYIALTREYYLNM